MLGKLIFSFFSLVFLGGTVVWAGYNLQSGNQYPVQVFEGLKSSVAHNSLTVPTVLNPEAIPETMNVLLVGIGGEGHDGANLTDSLMVATIDHSLKNIGLVSIPRDFLVFDEKDYYYKINSIYAYALEQGMTEEEAIIVLAGYVEEILGLSIDHYVKIDFEGFETLVDKLGGVEIDVKETIEDKYYPGPNYSYETFYIEAGTQHLDGANALKYARSRYSSAKGDVDRAARQQQIIDAVVKKASSLNPVWDLPKILSLVGIFKQNVSTDFSFDILRDLYITYQGLDSFTRNQLVLDFDMLDGLLVEDKRYFGHNLGYVLTPRAGAKNYSEIREYVSHLPDIDNFKALTKAVRQENSQIDVYSDLSKEKTTDIVDSLEAKGIKVLVRSVAKNDEVNTTTTTSNKLYLVWNEEVSSSIKYLRDRFEVTILDDGDLMEDPQEELTSITGLVPQTKHIADTESDMILYLYSE